MCELLGGGVAPGGFEGAMQGCFLDRLQVDICGTLTAPRAAAGIKRFRFVVDEFRLLFWREFHHSAVFVWVAEGGEDFATDSEVGMVHVGAFFGFGEGEG